MPKKSPLFHNSLNQAGGILPVVKRWVEKVEKMPEAKDDLGLFDLEIQFLVKDTDPFVLYLRRGSLTLRTGKVSKIDSEKTVIVESDQSTLTRLLEGRARFLDEWRADRIYLMGQLPRRAWFSRMIRISSPAS